MSTIGINSVTAILTGGPATIPAALRTQEVDLAKEKIKLPYLGGYEHFERTVSLDDDDLGRRVIYQWTMRTEVAE